MWSFMVAVLWTVVELTIFLEKWENLKVDNVDCMTEHIGTSKTPQNLSRAAKSGELREKKDFKRSHVRFHLNRFLCLESNEDL